MTERSFDALLRRIHRLGARIQAVYSRHRYHGNATACALCGRPIIVGDDVWRRAGARWSYAHADCWWLGQAWDD